MKYVCFIILMREQKITYMNVYLIMHGLGLFQKEVVVVFHGNIPWWWDILDHE